MKKSIWILTLALSLLVGQGARAQLKDGLGVGIMLGEPTGLAFKMRTGEEQAVAVGVAWSFTENPSFQFQMDYLLHNFEIFNSPGQQEQLALYYGLGGRLRLKDNSDKDNKNDEVLVGVRLPVGITYLFKDAPVDIFLEAVPILDVVPDTDFGWGAAFGAHFYF